MPPDRPSTGTETTIEVIAGSPAITASGASPAPATPTDAMTDAAMAQRVHGAYCERIARVGYEPFKDEWMQAARNVKRCEADPDAFVKELESMNIKLDPEDLADVSAINRYRRCAHDRDQRLLWSFYDSSNRFDTMYTREGAERALSDLKGLCSDLDATFRVAAAHILGPECFEEVARLCGRSAADDLRESAVLRRNVTSRFQRNGIDGDTLLAELDRVRARLLESLAAERRSQEERAT